MIEFVGYALLAVGALLLALTGFDASRRSLPVMFAATMLFLGGLVILQLSGVGLSR